MNQVTPDGDVSQPIQWSSEMHDAELCLVYYNYRYYNPVDGRWTRRDPIGIEGGSNLFYWCNNSPIIFTDYLGLDSESDTNSSLGSKVNCKRKFSRFEINPGNRLKKIVDKVGIKKFKLRVALQEKKCEGCCKNNGKPGKSTSISIFGQFEVEGEMNNIDIFGLVKVSYGLYARTGGTGSLSVGRSSCNNVLFGNGCINLYAELGLMARLTSSISSADFGARGGGNIRVSMCASVGQNTVELKTRICASVRARVWVGCKIWPFQKVDYNVEWQSQICSQWFSSGNLLG